MKYKDIAFDTWEIIPSNWKEREFLKELLKDYCSSIPERSIKVPKLSCHLSENFVRVFLVAKNFSYHLGDF